MHECFRQQLGSTAHCGSCSQHQDQAVQYECSGSDGTWHALIQETAVATAAMVYVRGSTVSTRVAVSYYVRHTPQRQITYRKTLCITALHCTFQGTLCITALTLPAYHATSYDFA